MASLDQPGPEPATPPPRPGDEVYRGIFEGSADALLIAGDDGRLEDVNPPACELLGRARSGLLGRSFFDLAPPELRPALGSLWDKLLSERRVGGTLPVLRLGERALIEFTATAHVRPGLHVAILRDVTLREATAERSLRAERLLARTQAGAHIGCWAWDGVSDEVEWTEETYRIFGVPPGERIDLLRFLACIHPGDRARVRALVEGGLQDGRPFEYAHRIVRPDGEVRAVQSQVEVEHAADGRLLRLAGTVQDVTDKVAAQAALLASEARFRGLAERLPDAVFEMRLRPSPGFAYVSPAVEEITGHPPEAFYADLELARKLIHPDDLDAALKVAATPGAPAVVRIVRADGQVRWLETRATSLSGADGTPRVVGMARDITEQRTIAAERERLLDELGAERCWLELVIIQAPVPILLAEGFRGERLVANASAEELFGRELPRGAGVEQYVGMLLTPDGRALGLEELPIYRALRGEAVGPVELVVRRRDGTERSVLTRAGPLGPREGSPRAVVVHQDITVARELERQREEWTSVIAHDLRQPASAIHLYATQLARQADSSPAARGKAERILAATKRLDRMIVDLLDASRIESRRLDIQPQPTDLPALVREAVERSAGATTGHEVRLELAAELPQVPADPARIEQVLANLLSNAAKYGFPGSPIRVAARRLEGAVEVEVENEGPGIPPGELKSIFQRFHRSPAARGGGVAGLGLGLYICRGLVEAHGGRIRAESEPDRTTRVVFTLPLA